MHVLDWPKIRDINYKVVKTPQNIYVFGFDKIAATGLGEKTSEDLASSMRYKA